MAHPLQFTAKHSTIHEVDVLLGRTFFVACTRHGMCRHLDDFELAIKCLEELEDDVEVLE